MPPKTRELIWLTCHLEEETGGDNAEARCILARAAGGNPSAVLGHGAQRSQRSQGHFISANPSTETGIHARFLADTAIDGRDLAKLNLTHVRRKKTLEHKFNAGCIGESRFPGTEACHYRAASAVGDHTPFSAAGRAV